MVPSQDLDAELTMKDHVATALLALLIASAPGAAHACISMMANISSETFPLDFLWLGNAVSAAYLLFFGRKLIERKSMRRALVVSSLIFGAGIGLFASNTLAFDLNFTAIVALGCGVVLAGFEIRRSWSELAVLLFIMGVSTLATFDAIDDSERYEKYGPTGDETFVFGGPDYNSAPNVVF